MILFGGGYDGGVYGDLWSWDGSSWRKLSDSGPEPRVMGHVAYDKRRDRIVLFGGRRASGVNSDLGRYLGVGWCCLETNQLSRKTCLR